MRWIGAKTQVGKWMIFDGSLGCVSALIWGRNQRENDLRKCAELARKRKAQKRKKG